MQEQQWQPPHCGSSRCRGQVDDGARQAAAQLNRTAVANHLTVGHRVAGGNNEAKVMTVLIIQASACPTNMKNLLLKSEWDVGLEKMGMSNMGVAGCCEGKL